MGQPTFGGSPCGGDFGCGTFFKITPEGQLTTLYNFCSQKNCSDGATPAGALVQGASGNFYGVTSLGGANCPASNGCGTVFEVTPAGKLTTLYSFCSQKNCTDGSIPEAGLVLATNGNFYGTTNSGGAKDIVVGGLGTVFEITPAGKLTTLHSFCSQVSGTKCLDGAQPTAGLVQASNGKFYGTASQAGVNRSGTVFEITAAGKLTTLHSFNSTDGSLPSAALVQATDGNLYSTTAMGGANNAGTIFRITPTGTFTTLYNFCPQAGCPGGGYPAAGLVQATNGNLLGLDYGGDDTCDAPYGCGAVYGLSLGLSRFVAANPGFGETGRQISILGNNLSGTSSVTFNGTPATFDVVSDSYIKAEVPSGATSGPIEVTTTTGTLSSNVPFQVK